MPPHWVTVLLGGVSVLGCAVLYLQWRDWRSVEGPRTGSPLPDVGPERFSPLCVLVAFAHFILPLVFVALWAGLGFELSSHLVFVVSIFINGIILCLVLGLWPPLRGFIVGARSCGLVWHPLACLWGTFALAGMAGVIVNAGLWLLKAVSGRDFSIVPQDMLGEIAQNREDIFSLALVCTSVVIAAPLAEEVFFRGVLYPRFKRGLGVWRASSLTGLLFGLVHFNVGAFLPLAFMGAYFCLVYEKTGSLYAPIVAHGLFNLQSFLVVVLFPKMVNM
ncbi:MAG: CPBP family intramembrane metalloprotease [Puniceicoccales bacterium]|jgi:membrane protease YdiL (CAAX protease family)|nr:CPBP family intramembrane metalloprotease [Puniceicoccales bacterium]